MWLDLSRIIENPGEKALFEVELSTDNLLFSQVKSYKAPPRAEGFVTNVAGVLELSGTAAADMVCICDRCGGEFESTKITELAAVISEDDSDGENPDVFPLEGDGVTIDEIVETLFILDMETKFLCSPDCKGLCPGCGKNLNLGSCECRKEIDPRMAVLEQLLDK